MQKLPHTLEPSSFTDYFKAIHDRTPFKWQSMLMERVATEQWPDLIDLPTASGKTACMDVAVFALAMGLPTPRRIWFVVDRRIVVDEAYERAKRIAGSIQRGGEPILKQVRDNLHALSGRKSFNDQDASALGVARLRGGVPKQLAWTQNPLQPAIITSTIDQLGSRLLFRGYGVSDRTKPIHAALSGNDSLIILDEAHLAAPFFQTVKAVERFRKKPWAKEPLEQPFKLVVMSVTLPKDADSGAITAARIFPLDSERDKALSDKPLQQRIRASKPAELVIAANPKTKKGNEEVGGSADDFIADAANRARRFVDERKTRIAIMVNRVATAQDIVRELEHLYSLATQESAPTKPTPDIQLLTGRMRPVDRDEFIRLFQPKLCSGSDAVFEQPIILVTTQCLEVGADFSFDALISECASLDSLRQRFGRLNRLGDAAKDPSPAAILIRKKEIKAEESLDDQKPFDPIYGNALARTWNWLTSINSSSVDMGIAALQPHVSASTDSGAIQSLIAPALRAPIMLPAYVDLWSQTNPRPSLEPDVSLFLHGVPPPDYQPRTEVKVLWRHESSDEILQGTPPLSMEMLSLPMREFIAGMKQNRLESGDDLEGGFEEADVGRRDEKNQVESLITLRIWRSGELLRDRITLDQLRPNDVIVLPANDHAEFKRFCHAKIHLPTDVYEWAYLKMKECVAIRYPLAFTEYDSVPSLTVDGDEPPTVSDIRELALGMFRTSPLGSQTLQETEIATALEKTFDSRLFFAAHSKDSAQYVLVEKPKGPPIPDWGFETNDDEDDLSTHGPKSHDTLAQHTEDVKQAFEHLSNTVDQVFHRPLQTAIDLHDVGKVDGRFQRYLASPRLADNSKPLAKSNRPPNRAKDRKMREWFRVPPSFRHELVSAQWAAAKCDDLGDDRDLILHLIAAHHGYCRPFAPVIEDDKPPELIFNGETLAAEERLEHPPWHLDSGIAERFWKLTRKHGWWNLAYLESLLRWADQYASAQASEDLK